MKKMDIKSFKEYVRNKRDDFFDPPYELVYKVFISNGFDKQNPVFFKENASSIVEILREGCWNNYVPMERQFTAEVLCSLVSDEHFDGLSPKESVVRFAELYPEHIYQLSLSNTQSRRARAGKEFEAIIELILIGSGIPMDTQGNIGKRLFLEKGLGKLVDVVSPGVLEYVIDKNDVVLISAKTTLRERWQEVPEEMGRTGAKEMFLATLDENISDDVLETLYESNIRIVTTRSIKEKRYPNNKRVLDFERLIDICLVNCGQWKDYRYSDVEIEQLSSSIEIQIEKHSNHEFILKYYYDRLRGIKNNNE